MGIKDEMPLLARHEGEWKGTYTVVDREGKITDSHASHLTCSFPTEGEFPYHQTNRYTWDDGKTEEIQFPATYKDGKLWFDTERINGFCWETDENTIVLHWTYVADPTVELYELIYLSPDGQNRTRTWHWLKAGRLFQRTLINEEKVA